MHLDLLCPYCCVVFLLSVSFLHCLNLCKHCSSFVCCLVLHVMLLASLVLRCFICVSCGVASLLCLLLCLLALADVVHVSCCVIAFSVMLFETTDVLCSSWLKYLLCVPSETSKPYHYDSLSLCTTLNAISHHTWLRLVTFSFKHRMYNPTAKNPSPPGEGLGQLHWHRQEPEPCG